MKTHALKERFIEMRAEGMSFAVISKELGVAKGTAMKWSREFRRDVATLTETRMEAIKSKYKLTQSQQVERYGRWLKKIDTELTQRDLKDLRTDQLILLAVKLTAELRLYLPIPEETPKDSNVLTADDLTAISRGEFVVMEE